MSNPYSTPSSDSFQPSPGGPPFQQGQSVAPGLVNQVRIFAILAIVQGALEVLMGLLYAGMGAVFPKIMLAAQKEDEMKGMNQEQFFWIMTATYITLGVATVLAGGMHIFAGIQNYRFKGRVLGFVALATGVLAWSTCYCLPTGIALGVYGLIVLINPQVAYAFQMREKGQTVDNILATFSPYRNWPPQGQQEYPPT